MSQDKDIDTEIGILNQAVRKVPALRYAYGLAGLAAVSTIVMGFVEPDFKGVVSIALVLAGSTAVFVFAMMVAHGEKAVAWAGVLLVWSIVITLMASVFFTISALAFNWPPDWLDFVKKVNREFPTMFTTEAAKVPDSDVGIASRSTINVSGKVDLDFIPSGTNIILFNSSQTEGLANDFYRHVAARNSGSLIDTSWANKWIGKRQFKYTRIYFNGAKENGARNEQVAYRIADALPGKQYVIRYESRNTHPYNSPKYWPEYNGIGYFILSPIDDDRDIAIFLSNDVVGKF